MIVKPLTVKRLFAFILSIILTLSVDTFVFAEDIGIENEELQNEKELTLDETQFLSHLAFAAEVFVDKEGYGIMGTFKDIPLDGVQIRPMYSIDNKEYVEEKYYDWKLPEENSEEEVVKGLQKQICARGNSELFSNYLLGKIDSFYVKLHVTTSKGDSYDTNPAFVTRGEALSVPEKPIDFRTQIEFTRAGIVLYGVFSDFTTDIKRVCPIYSMDDTNYQYILDKEGGESNEWNLTVGTNGEEDTSLIKQTCSFASQEPFSSYLSGELNQFYMKLRITTWSGEEYDTQSALISRNAFQLQPEETSVIANYPVGMRVRERHPSGFTYYGKYQITVREGTSKEELISLLPDSLPVDVQLMKSNADGVLKIIDQGTLNYPVQWQIPDIFFSKVSDNPIIIENAITDFNIPEGEEVSMLSGKYILTDPIEFDLRYSSKKVRLYINVIPKDEKAKIGLSSEIHPLSIVFNKKPTKATSIHYSYFVEGMDEWMEKGELLSNKSVDYQPLNMAYGYIPLFGWNETPWREYLSGEINYFLIGIEIEGGVYDGECHTLKWPKEYELPPNIPDFKGSGGNENNAGSDDKGENENDKDEGGLYPGIPEEDKPPSLIPPLDEEVVKPGVPDKEVAKPGVPDNSVENGDGLIQMEPVLPENDDNSLETNLPELSNSLNDLKEETKELEELLGNTQSNDESEEIKENEIPMKGWLEVSFFPISKPENSPNKQKNQLDKKKDKKKDKNVLLEESTKTDTADSRNKKENLPEQKKDDFSQNIVKEEGKKQAKKVSEKVGFPVNVVAIVFVLSVTIVSIIGLITTTKNTKIKAILGKLIAYIKKIMGHS